MKKKISVLLVLTLMMALFGCSSGSQSSSSAVTPSGGSAASGSDAAAPEKKEKYVVGFAQVGSESEWRIASTNEMQASYAASDRFELIFSDGQQKQENQIKAVRNFIQQKVDAIVLMPVVATGWDAVLTEAKEANIPVIIANRGLTMASADYKDYSLCYVGPNNILAGELLANAYIDKFADQEGPIYIALLEGTVGASSAVDRATGIANVINAQDKLVVKYQQSGDYTRTKGKEVMESFLKAAKADGVTLSAVISHSDDMAIGASQAIEEAGLKPGEDIIIGGIDGVRGAFEAMVENRYNFSVENPLGYGVKTMEILTDYLDNGVEPEDWVVLQNRIFAQDQAVAELPNRTY